MTIAKNQYNLNAAIISCFIASLYLFYEIVQLTVFNTISTDLMQDLHLSPLALGRLSATYLYVCAIFLIPIGHLFDRYPTNRLLLIAACLSTVGVSLLAITHSLMFAFIGRGLTGFGNAFAFLGCMRLASSWFPPSKIALVMGLVVTIGMSGGVVSQAPCQWLVTHLGWRYMMLINAFFGILIILLVAYKLKENPQAKALQIQSSTNATSLNIKIGLILRSPLNWCCGLYTGFLNLAVMLLGSLWIGLYLTHGLGYSPIEAANLSSLIFIGLIIGAPLIGWISDHLHSRLIPMLFCSFMMTVDMLFIIWYPSSATLMAFLLLLLGFMSAAQVLSYPIIAEHSSHDIESSNLGLVAVLINVIGGGAQMLFGWLINSGSLGSLSTTLPQYRFALMLVPLASGLSFFIALLIHRFKQVQPQ